MLWHVCVVYVLVSGGMCTHACNCTAQCKPEVHTTCLSSVALHLYVFVAESLSALVWLHWLLSFMHPPGCFGTNTGVTDMRLHPAF